VEAQSRREVFHVVSRATGQELFSQPVSAEWFRHDLIGRTFWAAAIAEPRLRGVPLKPRLEPVAEDNQVVGWMATLSSPGDEVLFRRRWPVAVLHGAARSVAQQYQGWLGDGRVLYSVSLEDAEGSAEFAGPENDIEFAGDDNGRTLDVPNLAMLPGLQDWRLVAPAVSYPAEVVLALHDAPYLELLDGIGDSRYAGIELAWAGTARIGYLSAERILVYEVASLTRLATPAATATLCPVDPEQLARVLDAEHPVVFFHTHVVPENWQARWPDVRLLACSLDDLRCFRRLPIGSLGVIAGSRPPLRIRAYGWPADVSELGELNTAVAVPSVP
jgi:hypothetical protein